MLGFFTDPYPDEILYSAAARYHERARNRKTSMTARDLFGNETCRMMVDFPTHLDNLIARLPPGHSYSADALIDKHTLFPFYVAFLPGERAFRIRQCMRNSIHGGTLYPLTGMLTNKFSVNSLRYCPQCAEADRENYGEAYWHRVHQIPGVVACAEHGLFLNEGYPHPRQVEDRNEHFVTAERAVGLSLVRPLDLNDDEHAVHFRIARDLEWLAKNETKTLNLAFFNARYRYVLFNARLSTFGGSVSLTKIKQKFAETYSEDLLKKIDCSIARKCTWIDRLSNNPNTGQHPLRHLLFVQFCGYSLEDFLKLPDELKPFGDAPFPCLNAAASHFRRNVVEKVHIKNKQKSHTEISGTFYCDCGFVYRRFGSDEMGTRRFNFDRVVCFGEVWDNWLRLLFKKGEFDSEKTAKECGIPERTLHRQIARLCLTDKHNSLKPKQLGKARMSFTEIKEKRVLYREKWLKIRMQNPDMSRSELRWVNEPVFSWLYKNDKEWIVRNFPERKENRARSKMVDWKKRDKETAPKIKALADELKALSGRPIFVSTTILFKRLQIRNSMKFLHHMPETKKAFEIHAESFEDYALRRIEWGLKTCLESIKIPGHYTFMKMTGFTRACLTRHPFINMKFEKALEKIYSTT